MFNWIVMYWMLLINKSDTREYIKKHEISIAYIPRVLFFIYIIIPDNKLPFHNSIIILILFILLLINIFVCNKIISKNNKILEQLKYQKEKEQLEDKARHLLIMVITLMKHNNYSINDINDYYELYTNKINSPFDNYDLKSIISNLNYKINYLKIEQEKEKNYNIYIKWRKTHYTYTDFNERNWWNIFEERYQEEFDKKQYNNYQQNYYKSYSNSNINNNNNSEKVIEYLITLELPTNTTDIGIIKAKYIKLIKKNHPDISHDNGEKAKEINEAYQELKKIFN